MHDRPTVDELLRAVELLPGRGDINSAATGQSI